MERIGSQAANFILSIILARILSPTEYGMIALITVFISIATVFVQGGFNTALIQSKQTDTKDYSSICIFSFLVAAILYSILFITAPFIALFYDQPLLVSIVRVLSLTLFIGAYNSVQVAYVTKKMQFKKLFISNIIAVITSGIAGIIIAYIGLGPWAIVVQQLGFQLINCVVLAIISSWHLTLSFSLSSVKKLVPFGSKVLISNLLVTVFLNIRSLIIGRVYDAESLAYFNRGKTFAATLMDAVDGTIQTVMLPTYSNIQDDSDRLKSYLRKSVSLSCYIIFPSLIGLASVSDPFITLILTEKWKLSVVFLQIFAIGYMTQPIQIATAQALKAIGRSDLTLKIEIYRKIAEIICLLITIPLGVKAIAWSTVVASFIACLISAPMNKRYLSYSYKEQIADIITSLLSSVIMFFLVNQFIIKIPQNIFLQLLLGVLSGIVIYIILSILFNNKAFGYIKDMLFQIFNNKKI